MAKHAQLTSRELLAQADALRAQAQVLIGRERPAALAQVKELISIFGFNASELGLIGTASEQRKLSSATVVPRKAPAAGKVTGKKASAKKAGTGVIKYRDANGNTWTGFGPRPKWLIDAFAAGASDASLRPGSAPAQ